MMLTNNKQKLIQSLQQKKYRNEHRLFVIEGVKIISEFVQFTNLVTEIYLSKEDILSEEIRQLAEEKNISITVTDERSLARMSSLTTPPNCLAVARMLDSSLALESLRDEVVVVLDQVQDPGNLGTIIRSCDWFGVKNIVCSEDTVDCYNPKVVQASMGSLCNVAMHYVKLNSFLETAKNAGLNVLGTLLNGVDAKQLTIAKGSVIVFGNEANGISEEVKALIDTAITILPSKSAHAESLNVATTVAIVLSKI